MKLAIIGSRNFKSKIFAQDTIEDILKNYIDSNHLITIISGGARGVDSWAEEIADKLMVKKIIFKPDWNKYGKKAGFLRNNDIINNADSVLAFWDGESKGTKHSIDLAIKKGISVNIYIRR